jgi:hypothetical protein
MKIDSTILREVKKSGFIPEWKSLSKGETLPVYIGDFTIKVHFYWSSDNTPDYDIKGMYKDDAFLMEKVIPSSPAYSLFKSKIQTFIDNTRQYGKQHHNAPDYLWREYFWKADPY